MSTLSRVYLHRRVERHLARKRRRELVRRVLLVLAGFTVMALVLLGSRHRAPLSTGSDFPIPEGQP